MKNGYYMDQDGHVLGYWELPEIPLSDKIIWVESNDRPKIFVSLEEENRLKVAELKAFLTATDYKIIKKLEALLLVDDPDVIERKAKRDLINKMEVVI